MTARCDFSDLPADQCAHCKGIPTPRASSDIDQPVPGWLRARYPGQCASCGEPYTTGTYIAYDSDTGRWVAECCALNGEVDW